MYIAMCWRMLAKWYCQEEVTPWRQAQLLEQKEGLSASLINCAA